MSHNSEALEFIQSIDSTWRGHELFAIWLVKQIAPRVIVDLGFDRGLSTIAFSYQNPGDTFGIDFPREGTSLQKKIAMNHALDNISQAIALNYIKNIHLIIGSNSTVSKTWHRKIDLLHIDWTYGYSDTKHQYETWGRFLTEQAIVLIHDVQTDIDGVGRLFQEIPLPKFYFAYGKGLGVIAQNQIFLDEIHYAWQKHAANNQLDLEASTVKTGLLVRTESSDPSTLCFH